jgi:transposase-like protein
MEETKDSSAEYKSPQVKDQRHHCLVCEKKFKVGDRVAAAKEHRWHIKCSKTMKPEFVGCYLEKEHKASSVDRDRVQRRLKKMRRLLKAKAKRPTVKGRLVTSKIQRS